LRQPNSTRFSAGFAAEEHEESGSNSSSGGRRRRSSGNLQQDQRKVRQFCRQVERALNLALTEVDGANAAAISGLFVEEVAPAPDCGRLLAYVLVPSDVEVAAALAELQRLTPRLREEVARAITRKRAPELAFVPVFGGEEGGPFDE
jgi:ribosome-binding factor A